MAWRSPLRVLLRAIDVDWYASVAHKRIYGGVTTMTDTQVWAGIAMFAMLGWGATNALYARGVKNQADALSTVEKVSGFIDNRISAILNRAKTIDKTRKPQQPKRNDDVQPEVEAAISLNEVFGGAPLLFGDQPDAETEVME